MLSLVDNGIDLSARREYSRKGALKAKDLGPFDLRRTKSRCEKCAISHVVCSRGQPCQRCVSKGLSCTYQTSGMTSSTTNSSLLVNPKGAPAVRIEIAHVQLDKYSLVMKSFFDKFLPRNRFSEHARLCNLDQSIALRHIVYAIGSMQLLPKGHRQRQTAISEAIQAYRMSCSTLRSQLETVSVAQYIATIQTTYLMGMFELMHASDAVGWRRHYLFGTRELIQGLGPHACKSGAAKVMILDIRLLEIISTVLYASRSFLATPPWLETMQFIWENEKRGLKDDLLDLVTLCGDHCLQSAEYIRSLPEEISPDELKNLEEIAARGIAFRLRLDTWKSKAELSEHPLTALDNVISWTVYHTFSIYLHTMFHANSRWHELGIAIPELQSDTVDAHMENLSQIISHALRLGDICPIIFLLPLYVAAIAVKSIRSRRQVHRLMLMVRDQYCVVVNSDSQVLPFWTPEDSFVGKDTGNSLLKIRRDTVLKHMQMETQRTAPNDE